MLNIYHYSDKKLDRLLTKQKQEEVGLLEIPEKEKEEKMARSKVYNNFYSSIEQISFFFDPIPTDLVSQELYNNPMYKKGNVLYEHKVNLETILIKAWQVVESPLKTSMLNYWTEDGKEEWADKITALEEIYGDRSRDLEKLVTAVLRYKGKTRTYFEESFINPNFTEKNRSQYAAMVPHLYLYPMDGFVVPYDVQKIEVK